MGTYTWEVMKTTMKGVDMRGALFKIPPGYARGGPHILKEFSLEATTPYVYDKFGAWEMFPYHDKSHCIFPNTYVAILGWA